MMDDANGLPFQIVQATPDDAEAVFMCSSKTMSTNYLQSQVFPPEKAHLTPPDELFAWRVRRIRKLLEGQDLLYFKVVPTENPSKVVGYCGWFKPGHFKRTTLAETEGQAVIDANANMKPEREGNSDEAEQSPMADGQRSDAFPACINQEAFKGFLASMDEERKRIWGDDANFWYLGALGVDPDYQRRGIARMLLTPGLERADRERLPTYLEATPAGALVYPKFGFRKVKDLAMFEGSYVMEFYIRPTPDERAEDS